jgi:two-component system chemotaxis response regulator CheY
MAKIMIIDDSGMTRKMMRAILEQAGHEVLEAVDGMSGIEQYFLERPDLVTLDLTMKGMHGLEVLEKLRAMDPNVKVLVATADIQRSTQELAIKGGAAGFLTKPLAREAVLIAVEQALKEGK